MAREASKNKDENSEELSLFGKNDFKIIMGAIAGIFVFSIVMSIIM